jgi:antitoxin (DNA-binding transcriptional repressor) of toxin-antitoxin stability system
METEKIGIREFRENLAGYLEGGKPLAITRHGETLGFFIPAQKRSRKAEVEAMRAAARELDAMIAAWGSSEDELMREYKQIQRESREKKRNTR